MLEVQERIIAMIDEGATVEEVEEDVIDTAPFDDDSKAALWLFTWASIPGDGQRREPTRRR